MAARGLGKGLDSLIPNALGEAKTKKEAVAKAKSEATTEEKEPQTLVKITKVEPNREQPRKNFDEDALQELADSIKQFGLLQPILVQDRKDYYEIIAGERRWRAAKLAGLKEVPVIIRNYTEQEIVEISLIENIQREDLNPIEEAQAYKRLLTEFHLKQDEVAERVSKSRAAVTNSIRLLKLNEDVQRMVVDEMISTGHARALLAVENPEEQYNLAQRIFDEKLSVRDVEKLVKNLHKPAKPKKTDDKTMQVIYQDIEEKLKQKLGRKVTVTSRGEGSGKIEIEFYNHEDLDRLLDVLNKRKEDARKKGTVNNMSSTFLNQIGLGEFDMGYLLIGMGAVILLLIIFLILLIVQIRKTSKLKKRLDKFLSGKDGASLEKDIAGLYEDNKFLKANTEKNKKDIRTLYKNMESAYQKMGLVKYDAFNQMGGQLSFSLALLDENNNGFIINSVHSSEGCYSYTKEIKLGQCAIDLGAEEAEALAMAMGE